MDFWIGVATGFCATVLLELIGLIAIVVNVDKNK